MKISVRLAACAKQRPIPDYARPMHYTSRFRFALVSVEMRSVPQQVAYWAKIGRAALDNPDFRTGDSIFQSRYEPEAGLSW